MPSHPSGRRSPRQQVRPCIAGLVIRSKVWFERGGRFAIGEGGVSLLHAVATERSLAGAAKKVGWSYRHAWGYVRNAEEVLGVKLLSTRQGRGRNRGTNLTCHAHEFIASVERLTRD